MSASAPAPAPARAPAAGAHRAPLAFEHLAGGRFAVHGELGFATAAEGLRRARALFEPHSVIELDLAGVTRADSAGLALLLEWVNWARGSAREIRFANLPGQILAIAQISEVEDMLRRAERWTGA